MMQHRGEEDAVPVAGDFQQERGEASKKRQPFQGQVGEPAPRSGVALVLSPQENDPPPPMKVLAVSKARAVFSDAYSEEACRHMREGNPTMFRFTSPRTPRSKS